MRKVIVYVNLTLDGQLAGPRGELDWMIPDEEMNQALSDELRDRVDTILAGRVFGTAAKQLFSAQAADPASPPALVDFATWMVETPTVVFSHATTPDLAATVAELREKPGKDMVLFGGCGTVQQFVRQNLADEYWIKLYPTAIGEGQPMFTGTRTSLELVHSKSHASGIVTLRYYKR